MNAAKLIIPKCNTRFVFDDEPLNKALEMMRESGYTALPVVSRNGGYVSAISEGDILRFVMNHGREVLSHAKINESMTKYKNPPMSINASGRNLLERAGKQSFIPITDDRGYYMGIVTRSAILESITKLNINI